MTVELLGDVEVTRTPAGFRSVPSSLNLPDGFGIVRVIRITDGVADIEIEDEGADPSLAGKTIMPWFQTTVDGSCVIVEREVMELEHNQVHVDEP